MRNNRNVDIERTEQCRTRNAQDIYIFISRSTTQSYVKVICRVEVLQLRKVTNAKTHLYLELLSSIDLSIHIVMCLCLCLCQCLGLGLSMSRCLSMSMKRTMSMLIYTEHLDCHAIAICVHSVQKSSLYHNAKYNMLSPVPEHSCSVWYSTHDNSLFAPKETS